MKKEIDLEALLKVLQPARYVGMLCLFFDVKWVWFVL